MDLNRTGDSLSQGGEFFTEIQRGSSPYHGGGQEGRHLRFLPSLNTRFPCKDSLGADGRLRKQEKKYDSRFTFFVGAHCASITRHIRSVGYMTATHMVKSTQARHKVNCRSV